MMATEIRNGWREAMDVSAGSLIKSFEWFKDSTGNGNLRQIPSRARRP